MFISVVRRGVIIHHADDMIGFLSSVVGVELDDRVLFQCEHQQRLKIQIRFGISSMI